MKRVFILEDHTLLRQSLVKTIDSEEGFSVVGEAGRGDDALRLIAATRADIVLMDIGVPGVNGLQVAEQLVARGLKLVFLTMYEDDATIVAAMRLGADGYVVKTASTDELLQALRAVANGESYLSQGIARRTISLLSGRAQSQSDLTQRELEILQLLSGGDRLREVGERLFLSPKTIKNHLTNVYSKLGVQTGAQAVAEAYRRGLVAHR
jgi:DNA-binding NarL/FixJ family response regulator